MALGLHNHVVSFSGRCCLTCFLDCRVLLLRSRAFPSHLIPASSSSDPTPVLFPGVDTLNHRLGTRASWLTDVNTPPATTSASMAGGLSVVLDEGVAAGQSR